MIKQQGKYQPELLKTYPPFKCDELELLFLTDWYISKINKNDPSKLSKITSIDEIGLYQEYNICYKLFYNLLGISCLFMHKFNNDLYVPIDTPSRFPESHDVLLISVLGRNKDFHIKSYKTSFFNSETFKEQIGNEKIIYNDFYFIFL